MTEAIKEGIRLTTNHGEKIADRMEKAFSLHVDVFEKKVLQPFCDRHNLRFGSGMGQFGFCTPNGTVLLEPWELVERYEKDTFQVEFFNDPQYITNGPQRRRGKGYRDWEPSFFQVYRDVWALLEQDFGNYTTGFSANDYNSPGYEKNLKKIKARKTP
jgi:hypothetical protein